MAANTTADSIYKMDETPTIPLDAPMFLRIWLVKDMVVVSWIPCWIRAIMENMMIRFPLHTLRSCAGERFPLPGLSSPPGSFKNKASTNASVPAPTLSAQIFPMPILE